jgi:hypothetical protein
MTRNTVDRALQADRMDRITASVMTVIVCIGGSISVLALGVAAASAFV